MAAYFLICADAAPCFSQCRNKITVVTLSDSRYQQLTDLTLPNKRAYCEKRDYGLVVVDFAPGNVPRITAEGEFPMCRPVRDALRNSSWVFYTGSDHVFTNFSKRLEDIPDQSFHFVVSADFNSLNTGSFFVRSDILGLAILGAMCASAPVYESHGWLEQQWLIDMTSSTYFKNFIQKVPNRTFNGYPPGAFGPQHVLDSLGEDGEWHAGDLMVHFPGFAMETRINFAKEYLSKVDTNASAAVHSPVLLDYTP